MRTVWHIEKEKVSCDIRWHSFPHISTLWRTYTPCSIEILEPSYQCFTFSKKDLVSTIEKYSVMIGVDLQHSDKVYNKKPKSGYQKMLAKILKVKPQMIDTYLVQKRDRQGLSWNILWDFIWGHLHDEDDMVGLIHLRVSDLSEDVGIHWNGNGGCIWADSTW